jgi:hypothetical protein
MSTESKITTNAIQALLRPQHHLPAYEIREMNDLVPGFAARYFDECLKDQAASRIRKNLIIGSTVVLSVAMSVAIIISAISGRPLGQAITSLSAPLINVIGSTIIGFMNRKC